MPDYDAEMLAEQALMIGLVDKDQAMQARFEAADGSPDAFLRVLLRKGLLTSWQVERLQKEILRDSSTAAARCSSTSPRERSPASIGASGYLAGIRSPSRCSANASSPTPTPSPGFCKEAEAGMKLVHPNIVQILDFGEEDKKHFA